MFSKNTFKLLLTVAFSASSCLYFRQLTVCWALSAQPKKKFKKIPKFPQIPQPGMTLHECDPCKWDISEHICWLSTRPRISCCLSPWSKALEEEENSSPCVVLAPRNIFLHCLKGSGNAFPWDKAGTLGKQAVEGPAQILPARCGQGDERCWVYRQRCSSPDEDVVLLLQGILALLRADNLASQSQ